MFYLATGGTACVKAISELPADLIKPVLRKIAAYCLVKDTLIELFVSVPAEILNYTLLMSCKRAPTKVAAII
jgi:hypothetical protein